MSTTRKDNTTQYDNGDVKADEVTPSQSTDVTDVPKNDPARDSRPEDDEQPMIVYKQRYVDSAGVQGEKEHRVPLSEWAQYEKDNNL